jgi:hypothetical protein
MLHTTLVTCLMACALGQTAPDDTTLTLRPQVTITTAEIALGQVVEIVCPPEMSARLAQVSLGSAPVPGLTRSITVGYLRLRLRRYGINPGTLTLVGETTVVQRAPDPVAPPTPTAATRAASQPGEAADPPCIRRSDVVVVQVHCGGVIITLEGRACQAGHPGETVTVSIPNTSRTLEAQVVGPGQVVIEL